MVKRVIKNIVMIALIIVLCIAMYFTVNGQRNNFADREKMMQKMSEEGTLPEMPENGEMSEGMERGKRENRNFAEGTNISKAITKSEREDFGNRKMSTKQEDGTMSEMPEGMTRGGKNNAMRGGLSNPAMIVLCTIEALGISILIIYLLLSKFNKLTLKETLENKSKIGSFIILVILVTAIITMLVMLINKNNRGNFKGGRNGMMPIDDEVERITKAEDIDSGENINTETINLSEHTSNITISEAGNYTLTGESGYTILVDADGEKI